MSKDKTQENQEVESQTRSEFIEECAALRISLDAKFAKNHKTPKLIEAIVFIESKISNISTLFDTGGMLIFSNHMWGMTRTAAASFPADAELFQSHGDRINDVAQQSTTKAIKALSQLIEVNPLLDVKINAFSRDNIKPYIEEIFALSQNAALIREYLAHGSDNYKALSKAEAKLFNKIPFLIDGLNRKSLDLDPQEKAEQLIQIQNLLKEKKDQETLGALRLSHTLFWATNSGAVKKEEGSNANKQGIELLKGYFSYMNMTLGVNIDHPFTIAYINFVAALRNESSPLLEKINAMIAFNDTADEYKIKGNPNATTPLAPYMEIIRIAKDSIEKIEKIERQVTEATKVISDKSTKAIAAQEKKDKEEAAIKEKKAEKALLKQLEKEDRETTAKLAAKIKQKEKQEADKLASEAKKAEEKLKSEKLKAEQIKLQNEAKLRQAEEKKLQQEQQKKAAELKRQQDAAIEKAAAEKQKLERTERNLEKFKSLKINTTEESVQLLINGQRPSFTSKLRSNSNASAPEELEKNWAYQVVNKTEQVPTPPTSPASNVSTSTVATSASTDNISVNDNWVNAVTQYNTVTPQYMYIPVTTLTSSTGTLLVQFASGAISSVICDENNQTYILSGQRRDYLIQNPQTGQLFVQMPAKQQQAGMVR